MYRIGWENSNIVLLRIPHPSGPGLGLGLGLGLAPAAAACSFPGLYFLPPPRRLVSSRFRDEAADAQHARVDGARRVARLPARHRTRRRHRSARVRLLEGVSRARLPQAGVVRIRVGVRVSVATHHASRSHASVVGRRKLPSANAPQPAGSARARRHAHLS